MLRPPGCQGGRTPLLIQEGDGAFATGVVTGPQCPTPNP